ncbi:MAG: DUF6502 family protein [Proteobacteria bacterium]|nr:DUF6502 family protein [Pseudomonadota bacterium]
MSDTNKEQTLQMALDLLQPVLRLAVREGVLLTDMSELLKRAYIEQAVQHLNGEKRRVTDAAVSTLTGVHRKDVKRIGSEDPLAHFVRPGKSLVSRVMELWSGDPRYLTKSGSPRPLAKRSSGCAPGEESFEDLIQEVTKGVPPKALLDAWLAQGAVMLDDAGRVCRANPDRAAGEELQSYRRTVGIAADRMHAAWANFHTEAEGKPHLLHSITGKGLLQDDVHELTALAKRCSSRYSGMLNRQVAYAEARGQQQGGTIRFSFGLQSYFEPVDRPQDEDRPTTSGG